MAINLNPFMRFDGYFLLSDLWEVENLQNRAFALCRWRLREALFGYAEPAPEPWPEAMRRRLLVWGYGAWIWRAALFFGIALTVYHLFFKVLGIFLMLVELVVVHRPADLEGVRRVVATPLPGRPTQGAAHRLGPGAGAAGVAGALA